MSQGTIDEFAGYARQQGVLPTLGAIGGFNQPHRGGRFHRVQAIPGFTRDIMSIDDRFQYGMKLADQFSTHPTPSSPISRPTARPEYTSVEAFRRLNVRLGLHQLDAELDDLDVDETRVIEIMQRLSPNEQRELGYNKQRLEFLRSALNQSEMQQALRGLTSVPDTIRQFLLGS